MRGSILRIGFSLGLGLVLALLALWMGGSDPQVALAASPIYVRPAGSDLNCNGTVNVDWSGGAQPSCAVQTIGTAVTLVDTGGTIHVAAGTYPENVAVGKSLTIIGAGASSTIVDGGNADRVFDVTSGPVSFANLTIQRGSTTGHGGGIFLPTFDGLTLTSVDVLSNTAQDGGGGLWTLGAVTVTGSLFRNNLSPVSDTVGGGVRTQGSLFLTDTQFISNTSGYHGGGASAGGPVMIYGGLFQSNRCTDTYCRGAGLATDGAVFITGTQFISNTAISDGGAVLVYGAATISDGSFVNNSAGNSGGAVLAFSSVALDGGLFQGNWCTEWWCDGGGLWAYGPLTVTGSQFISNTAGDEGGGACVYDGATVITGGLFQENQSISGGGGGGGLCARGALAVTGTQFIGNAAAGDGGGLYARSALSVTAARFIGNSAGYFGGGLAHDSAGDARLVNVLFARNGAGVVGGAAMGLKSTGNVVILHATIASPTVGSRAAIYVWNGTVGISNTIIASYTYGINNAGGTVDQDYNLLFNAPVLGVVGGGAHNQAGSPDLVDVANDDYHLASIASAAFNKGTDAGVTVDLDAKPRPFDGRFDIGCYEYEGVLYHTYLPLISRQTP